MNQENFLQKYGPYAVITGASSGIGEAYAKYLASIGLSLVLVARRGDRLEALSKELSLQHKVQVLPCVADLSQSDASSQVLKFVEENNLDVGLLINNAGFGLLGDVDQVSRERQVEMVDLNCRAVLDLTHLFLPKMRAKRKGGIVIVSSVVGSFPVPYFATYAATKAFDLAFAAAVAVEARQYNVDVLAVLPGLTESEFHAGAGLRKHHVPYRKASDVVVTTVNALGRRTVVVDGLMNKFTVAALRFLPTTWVAWIVGNVMRFEMGVKS